MDSSSSKSDPWFIYCTTTILIIRLVTFMSLKFYKDFHLKHLFLSSYKAAVQISCRMKLGKSPAWEAICCLLKLQGHKWKVTETFHSTIIINRNNFIKWEWHTAFSQWTFSANVFLIHFQGAGLGMYSATLISKIKIFIYFRLLYIYIEITGKLSLSRCNCWRSIWLPSRKLYRIWFPNTFWKLKLFSKLFLLISLPFTDKQPQNVGERRSRWAQVISYLLTESVIMLSQLQYFGWY